MARSSSKSPVAGRGTRLFFAVVRGFRIRFGGGMIVRSGSRRGDSPRGSKKSAASKKFRWDKECEPRIRTLTVTAGGSPERGAALKCGPSGDLWPLMFHCSSRCLIHGVHFNDGDFLGKLAVCGTCMVSLRGYFSWWFLQNLIGALGEG